MGQQETAMTAATEERGGGTSFRRMVLALLVAALMAAMMAVSAVPAFAAGNHFAKGKGFESVSTNPGADVNNRNGDNKNDACFVHGNCNPESTGTSNSSNGIGVANN